MMLTLDTVTLRPLDMQDLERIWRWHNDPTLFEDLVGPFRPVSREAEEEWLRRRCAFSVNRCDLAICEVSTGTHIGNIYLYNIDPVSRTGELGVFIGEAGARGKGYGSLAVRIMARHAFQNLGLERITLHVLAANQRAIRAYERCGFRREGTLRRHVFKKGARQDVLVMGLLADELQ